MVNSLGIDTWFARRRNENRIKRRSRTPQKQVNPEAEIDALIQPHVRRFQEFGRKVVRGTQQRKGEGKEILKAKLKGGVRGAYLAFGREAQSLFVDESKSPPKRDRRR